MNAHNAGGAAGYHNPWAMWLDFYHVLHSWQAEWCQLWAHSFLPPFSGAHAHEGHHQLEIPDPLAETAEPELFA